MICKLVRVKTTRNSTTLFCLGLSLTHQVEVVCSHTVIDQRLDMLVSRGNDHRGNYCTYSRPNAPLV